MSTQEQNTPRRDASEMKLITLAEFKDVIARAYKAGALAEREGKHANDSIIDSDSLIKAFDGFAPSDLIKPESKHP